MPSAETIQRIPAPTREEFEREYVERNRPVILTGVVDQWPAYTKWTPEYLVELAGDAEITAHFDEDGNFHRWYVSKDERVDRRMPLREFMKILQGEPADNRFYMTEHELELVSPQLEKDVDFTRYFEHVESYRPLLFLGRDTCMPLHYHGTTEGLLAQIHGTKRIALFGPDQFHKLYPRPWYGTSPLFSQVDGRSPDVHRFPRFSDARRLEFVLHPGEMLFIPVHWWHLTFVDGYQVSSTHFWPSRLRRWHFPSPGIQMLAREAIYKSKLRWSQAKSAVRRQVTRSA